METTIYLTTFSTDDFDLHSYISLPKIIINVTYHWANNFCLVGIKFDSALGAIIFLFGLFVHRFPFGFDIDNFLCALRSYATFDASI